MTTEILSTDDKEFLDLCEEEFKDRYTEKDEEYMKVFNAEPESPPIIENWWVRQSFGHYNDRRNNRRWHPYDRSNNRNKGNQDRSHQGRSHHQSRGYQGSNYDDRSDHNRGYSDYGYQERSNNYSKRGRLH